MSRRWEWLHDRHVTEPSLARTLVREDPLWPGQLATLVALLLYLALPHALTIGPGWPVPAAEAAVLASLVVAARGGREVRRRREVAIGLVLVAVLVNLVALGLIIGYLLEDRPERGGDLLNGGVIVWTTNLLLFAVLYWELDRGGPRRPDQDPRPAAPDLLFVQMTDDRYAPPDWTPRFGDYLYVSLTNQTAFSPTDTMPLTPRVKALMGVQGVAALATVGVIIARAVNLLG